MTTVVNKHGFFGGMCSTTSAAKGKTDRQSESDMSSVQLASYGCFERCEPNRGHLFFCYPTVQAATLRLQLVLHYSRQETNSPTV